jgi:hypothetical protein
MTKSDMEAPADHALHSYHAALRNLDKLEREDFREVIKSQFRPTLRERYLTVNYHRAVFNVEMMISIKDKDRTARVLRRVPPHDGFEYGAADPLFALCNPA